MPKIADVRLLWKKSPSLDIEKVKLHIFVNEGPEIINELSPEIESFLIVVPASNQAKFKVESLDSEGNVAMSEEYLFGIGDLELPLPATELGHKVEAIRDVTETPQAPALQTAKPAIPSPQRPRS